MTTYEAIVTKTLKLTNLRFPRQQSLVLPGMAVLVRLEDGEEVGAQIRATAFQEDFTLTGVVDSGSLVIGLPATSVV